MGANRYLVTQAEEVVAAALTRGKIRFQYEPKHFRIHMPKNGDPGEGEEDVPRVQRGFRPDFFLPDQNFYIEVGTISNKKHKLRWMRAAYPNVRVVVFDNKWIDMLKDWMDYIDGKPEEDILQWFTEAWLTQEYEEQYSVVRRKRARDEAKDARIRGVFGPSMRVA